MGSEEKEDARVERTSEGNKHTTPTAMETPAGSERPKKTKKPKVKLTGQNGNVFNLAGICLRALRSAGMETEASELQTKVMRSKSYDEALCHMADYCDVR